MPVCNSAHSQHLVATICQGTATGRLTSLWPTLKGEPSGQNCLRQSGRQKRPKCTEAGNQALQEGLPAIEEYCAEVHEALTWPHSLPEDSTAENIRKTAKKEGRILPEARKLNGGRLQSGHLE